MSKGKAKVNYIGSAGDVVSQTVPSWGFLYETSTIKNPRYNIGDRAITPDGREFRYAKAGNIIANIQQGVKCYNLKSDGVNYAALLQSQAIDDTSVKVDGGGATDWDEDELRGAYIIIHTHSDLNHQFRGVIGNTPSDANGYITIYLDARLTHDLTTSHAVEVHLSPYSDVRQLNSTNGKPGDRYTSVIGMPNVSTTVANQYLWLQTSGPCWANPHGTLGYSSSVNERELVFDWEGSICPQADAVGSDDAAQRAGFQIERQTSGTGSAFFMLQIN